MAAMAMPPAHRSGVLPSSNSVRKPPYDAPKSRTLPGSAMPCATSQARPAATSSTSQWPTSPRDLLLEGAAEGRRAAEVDRAEGEAVVEPGLGDGVEGVGHGKMRTAVHLHDGREGASAGRCGQPGLYLRAVRGGEGYRVPGLAGRRLARAEENPPRPCRQRPARPTAAAAWNFPTARKSRRPGRRKTRRQRDCGRCPAACATRAALPVATSSR